MAHSFSTVLVLALLVVCVSGLDGESSEDWFPGPAGETKPVSPTIIGISGGIFCQNGGTLSPIEGAYAKVVCAAEGKKTYTIISAATDKKGFFMETRSLHEIERTWDIKKHCKGYLHSSPLKSCKVATNVNNGITGAPLKSYKSLPGQHMKVFSVGPFIYSLESLSESSIHIPLIA